MKSKINWEPKMNYHTNERFIETVNKAVVERFSEENKLSKNKKNDKNAIEYFSKPNTLGTTKQIKVEQLLL